MSLASNRRLALLADASVVLAIVLLVALPVWPGVFTVDSQAMYRAAISGEVSNWYAPVLQSIWGVLDATGAPTSTPLVLAAAGLVVGVMSCLRLGLGRRASWIATAVIIVFPPVYSLAGWIGRDVWFAALLVGTVSALGWAIRLPERRWPLLGAAFLTSWFAADARQNGFPALIVVGAVAGWAWWVRVNGRPRERRRPWLATGAGIVCTALIGFASMTLVRSFVVARTYGPDEVLYYQDLIAMSLKTDTMLVPESLRRTDDVDVIRRTWVRGQVGATIFVPDSPFRYSPYRPSHTARVRHAWVTAVRRHPLAYIGVRRDLMLQVLGLRSGMLGGWFDRSDHLSWRVSDELKQDLPGLSRVRASYLDAFDGSPRGHPGRLHAPWIYLVCGVVGAILLVVVGGWQRVFGWTVLSLQVLLQAVLAVAAPLVEYRFEYFQVILGLVVAVLGASAWWQRQVPVPADRREKPSRGLERGRT